MTQAVRLEPGDHVFFHGATEKSAEFLDARRARHVDLDQPFADQIQAYEPQPVLTQLGRDCRDQAGFGRAELTRFDAPASVDVRALKLGSTIVRATSGGVTATA